MRRYSEIYPIRVTRPVVEELTYRRVPQSEGYAWDAKDTDILLALFTPDGVWQEYRDGTKLIANYRGRAEIDRAIRPQLEGYKKVSVGVAGVVEGLSSESRAYFAAGGLGILIGDGQLSYRREKILEEYYAYSLNKWATLTFDYQFINNPGYNADRGPVSIFSGRFHAEF